MTGTLRTWFYFLHRKYTTHDMTYTTHEKEFEQGVKYTKYYARVFRHIETGEDVTVPKRKEKVWIEWDDGTETVKYEYWVPM